MIDNLMAGYDRFHTGYFQRNQKRLEELALRQTPEVAIVSCRDSRVDPCILFDAEPGEIFVIRNLANLVSPFETGGHYHGTSAALEFAVTGLIVKHVAKQPVDRASLDQAYSDAMAGVAARYPENQEVAVLYAESLMDLRPWVYWAEDGSPNPGIADALASLDSVIAVNEKHPGACHFFIHAVEKLYLERAIECAERLANLMPGAGHLVPMPGHIYIRVGRYLDAVKANKHAIHADETYIQDQNPAMGMYTAGYYPHNYDFMAFAILVLDCTTDGEAANPLVQNKTFNVEKVCNLTQTRKQPFE